MTISSIMQYAIPRLLISSLVCIFALAFSLQMASATQYYVATTGVDTNAGTAGAPFLTLNKCSTTVVAGDTCHVAPGTYSGTIYCSIPGVVASPTMVCMQTSGTASSPITFISDTKWGAKLTCQTDNPFFILYASYITVSGFDMTCPGTTPPNVIGFAATTYGDNGHNTLSNNYLHDFATSACVSTGVLGGSDTSIVAGANIGHNIFDSNIIHHGGAVTSGQPICNQFHGIYAGSPYDIITNNVVSGIVGYGIHSYGGGVCHETISGNTIFDNSNGGIILADDIVSHYDYCANGGKTDYETLTNNIAVNNGFGRNFSGGSYAGESGGITVTSSAAGTGTNNFLSNNLVYGNNLWDTQAVAPSSFVNNKTGSDSTVFVSYQADKTWAPAGGYSFSNYAEKAGSPSINAGIATGAPSHDVVNTPRPQGSAYDIGAYEYVSAADTQAPTVPTNLSGTAISSSQINLTWTASTDNVAVTGYKVFRNGTQVGTSATASYSDTGLAASTVYSYTVAAYDAAGNNSAQSVSANAIALCSRCQAIAVGRLVITTANLNVRQSASPSATKLGTEAVGSLGIVIGGPTTASAYTWWQVYYANGISGWSIADYLQVASAASSPALGMADPLPSLASTRPYTSRVNQLLQ